MSESEIDVDKTRVGLTTWCESCAKPLPKRYREAGETLCAKCFNRLWRMPQDKE